MSKILDTIKKILVDELGVDETAIIPSASFIDDLNMDPNDLAEFFTTIEDNFSQKSSKLEIPEEDSDNIVTVQNLVDYLLEAGIDD
ncbi:MAG: acyl carrier protein [Dehalococcoidia bacterium]